MPKEDEKNLGYELDKLRREMVSLLDRAAGELEGLRRANGELAPKADAYDTVRQILRLLPQPAQGYGEDLVWRFRNRAAALRAEFDS